MRVIIADTSCLILLDSIGRILLLKELFTQITVTDKVIEEYKSVPDWIEVRSDYDVETYLKLNLNFGAGESSCIALAQKIPNPLLIKTIGKLEK